ncbi:GWxTD domain-containing protein [candidate division KSB1 bacterium]|nr:GWxTD domain-containing protein [candidate division KSB1 bacterium]NIR71472.1 GWxTD domain-containing protein [candidate division KSB1 bacterium]NIS23393.1 GWxTD domain-containing protein [candidate division KSB1 bacterium]NIT70284.1 GWxTD domain-containing protein [candidate division KSB1 bacterium]NIU24007.1 GWxTD domain-containing protein [candidate division KSB1 bacterium]
MKLPAPKMFHNHKIIFFLVFTLVLISRAVAQSGSDFTAFEYYQRGLQLAEEGKVKPAIQSLQEAVDKDDQLADAYHQLALLYPQLGTVRSRLKATRALERALKLDRNNIRYHLDMAKLYLKKDMPGMAKDCFEEVLELDPYNAEAYYNLGLLKEQDMLWHKDLINPKEHVVFHFADEATDDMEEAREYFINAVESEPQFALAYYHLALIQYELSDYPSMAWYLKKAVNVQPTNKDFHLFLGLAFHRMGRYDSASLSFENGQQYMSDKERTLFSSIEPLLNSATNEHYSTLKSNKSKNGYESRFWKERDPLFMSDYNERLLEHHSRFAYANLRFGKAEKEIEGWQTDQGQTYIRFGPPQSRFRTRPSIELTFNGKNPLVPSTEYWVYEDFELRFEDLYLSRNFKFKRAFYPENDSKYQFERIIEEVPELYVPDFGGKYFEIPGLITQFMGDAGKTEIELSYGIASEMMSGRHSDHVSIKKGLFVFDEKWQENSKTVVETPFVFSDSLLKGETSYWLGKEHRKLEPGRYNFAFEFLDQRSGNVGRYLNKLEVRTFPIDRLAVSDLLLAVDVQVTDSTKATESLKTKPSLFHKFTREQPIFVYFEIYNLQLDKNNLCRYQIDTRVSPVDKEGDSIVNLVGEIFGIGKSKPYSLSTSYDYEGNSTKERIYNSLQLVDARPGEYVLKIKITDLNVRDSIKKDVNFEIVN